MQVETSVDEADIGRIKLDDRATFTVDAFPGETFSGTVTQIRKAAQIVQNVVTYTVVIAVGNPGGRLLPGMTANVKLVVAEKRDVLKVPNAALRFRPPGADDAAAAGAGGAGGAARTERSGPGAGGASGGGGSRLDALRGRLITTYKLDAAQQQKLDAILQETRSQFAGLQGLPEAERQARIQKNREATRARIREILTPEQRARYDADTASRAGRGGAAATPGRLWIAGPDGKPQAVQVTLGISDGQSTELLRGNLEEGQEVLVGLAGPGSGSRPGASGRPSTTPGPRLRL
jgi:HlyD family secretion protein